MKKHDKVFLDATHRKFADYRRLIEERGPEMALEDTIEESVPHQKELMTPFIGSSSLAVGFRRAIPFFEKIGMEMDVVDISGNDRDGVLEIQKYCPYLEICKEYGFETPCQVVCEIDVAAIRRAFAGMKADILARQAFGDCVCVFKYEREKVQREA